MHTVTVELSEEIYEQAEQIAQKTQRPIEQIVVEWIHPPAKENLTRLINTLENLSNEELVKIARSNIPADYTRRLQELLTAQQQRDLTDSEQREAATLVEQEDFLTLRKARALFLLKQRNALSKDLNALLT